MIIDRATQHNIELRHGPYERVLSDVHCDALICDTPYSKLVHSVKYTGDGRKSGSGTYTNRRGIGYAHWSPEQVRAFVDFWAPRTRGWMVSITDPELFPAWRDSMRLNGRHVFHPLPVLMPGMNVRLVGDGPSTWSLWVVVSRPPALRTWGTLPGGYQGSPFDADDTTIKARGDALMGSKPLWLMRALVRHYSRRGDLICDPCAGSGTTLLAAAIEGRHSIGAEISYRTIERAAERLSRPYTPATLFGSLEGEQMGLTL